MYCSFNGVYVLYLHIDTVMNFSTLYIYIWSWVLQYIPQLESAQEETERRSRQVTELEKEKVALGEERMYLNSRLTKEKEEAQKHVHTIAVLNSELSSVQQQVLYSISFQFQSAQIGNLRRHMHNLSLEGTVLDIACFIL